MNDEIQQGDDVQEDLDQAAQHHDMEHSGAMNPAFFTKPFSLPRLTPKEQVEADKAQLQALNYMFDKLFR